MQNVQKFGRITNNYSLLFPFPPLSLSLPLPQSRAVRNCVPNFVWTLKRDDVLFRGLTKDSMVNHFAKASSFTTKVSPQTENNIIMYMYIYMYM